VAKTILDSFRCVCLVKIAHYALSNFVPRGVVRECDCMRTTEEFYSATVNERYGVYSPIALGAR